MGAGCFAEYLFTLPQLFHALADGLDNSRHVRAGDRVLGFEKPSPHQAKNIRPPDHDMPDIGME